MSGGAASGTVVLAIGAHPDDLEELASGTLALLVRGGVPVHLAIATGGEMGIHGVDPDEARRVRLAEAERAAELLGAAGLHPLGGIDGQAGDGLAERTALVSLIRRVGANLLLTHPPDDYHPDHRAVSRVVADARVPAGAAGLVPEPPLVETPDLAYLDTALGVGFEPHVWIDVGETIEQRRAMLACHRSQAPTGLAENAEAHARLRGAQRGCSHAEAFRGCGTWPRPDGGIRRLVLLTEGAPA